MNRLTDDTLLYRAITKKQWLDRDREINEKAFTLRFLKTKQRWEKGLSCDLIEKKSYQYINECFGIIKLSVKDIRDLGLEVDNDHDTHVNIINLPDPDLQKQESKDIAIKLAKKAILSKDWFDNPYRKK
ncbi:hypothetical protein [Geminocystis herdmanii]|uniref:hypothetical protein n=1 Tax=Geminocystis herdmanii TaxID=669359 RepID=UPI00034CD78A|nr:hypothetical protein [Geminocystis herdmanii]